VRLIPLIAVLLLSLFLESALCEEAKEAPSISLPTIRIYGERRPEEVSFGEKKGPDRGLRFQADRPLGEKGILDLEGVSGIPGKKPLAEASHRKPEGIFSIGVKYGTFDSSELIIKLGGEKDQGGFSFGAGHTSTEGHVEGSKSSLGGAETAIMFRMSNRLIGYLGARGFGGQEGLWRFNEVRDTESWEGLLRLNLDLDKLMDISFNFDFHSLRLSDRNSGRWANENRSSIELNGNFISEKVSVRGEMGYNADFLRRNLEKEKHALFRSSAFCRFPTRENLVIGLGVSFYYLRMGGNRSLLQPFGAGELLFADDRVKLLIRFRPRLEVGSLADAYHENRFLNLWSPFPYRKRPFDLTGELWLKTRDKLETGLEVKYALERSYPVWTDSSSTWALSPGDLVGRADMGLRMRGKLSERLSMSANLSLTDARFRSGDRERKVPYVPRWKGRLDVKLRILRRLFLYGKIEALGRRYASYRGSDTLSPYIIAGIEVSQYIGSGFRFYICGDNILGKKYEIWRGYTMPGAGWYVGVENLWL